jgi:hypothetical protein
MKHLLIATLSFLPYTILLNCDRKLSSNSKALLLIVTGVIFFVTSTI